MVGDPPGPYAGSPPQAFFHELMGSLNPPTREYQGSSQVGLAECMRRYLGGAAYWMGK